MVTGWRARHSPACPQRRRRFYARTRRLRRFQYKLLHTIRSTSLQKDINKLAAEGLRVSPGTLLDLQANPSVIVEKAAPAFKLRYQYIIKETARISSGEREVEKVQEQAYTLIGKTELGTAHLMLFEQPPAE